jgi:hypothetical protein
MKHFDNELTYPNGDTELTYPTSNTGRANEEERTSYDTF